MKSDRLTDAMAANDTETKMWKTMFAAAKGAYDTGQFRQCEALLHRLMEQAGKLTESTFAINACRVGLGAVYVETGKLDKAKEQLEITIDALSGSDDPALKEACAAARRFYAQVMLDEGNQTGAEEQLRSAIEILEPLGIQCAVPISYALIDLALLYITKGKLNEAQDLMFAAMKLLDLSLGSDNPECARAHLIYNICASKGEDEFLSQVEDGIQRLQYQFGSKHPNITRALRWYSKRRREQAETDKINNIQSKLLRTV